MPRAGAGPRRCSAGGAVPAAPGSSSPAPAAWGRRRFGAASAPRPGPRSGRPGATADRRGGERRENKGAWSRPAAPRPRRPLGGGGGGAAATAAVAVPSAGGAAAISPSAARAGRRRPLPAAARSVAGRGRDVAGPAGAAPRPGLPGPDGSARPAAALGPLRPPSPLPPGPSGLPLAPRRTASLPASNSSSLPAPLRTLVSLFGVPLPLGPLLAFG